MKLSIPVCLIPFFLLLVLNQDSTEGKKNLPSVFPPGHIVIELEPKEKAKTNDKSKRKQRKKAKWNPSNKKN